MNPSRRARFIQCLKWKGSKYAKECVQASKIKSRRNRRLSQDATIDDTFFSKVDPECFQRALVNATDNTTEIYAESMESEVFIGASQCSGNGEGEVKVLPNIVVDVTCHVGRLAKSTSFQLQLTPERRSLLAVSLVPPGKSSRHPLGRRLSTSGPSAEDITNVVASPAFLSSMSGILVGFAVTLTVLPTVGETVVEGSPSDSTGNDDVPSNEEVREALVSSLGALGVHITAEQVHSLQWHDGGLVDVVIAEREVGPAPPSPPPAPPAPPAPPPFTPPPSPPPFRHRRPRRPRRPRRRHRRPRHRRRPHRL